MTNGMRIAVMVSAALPACTPTPPARPAGHDLLFVRPYRAAGDQCRLVGESAITASYLDDAADLVACPGDYEGVGVFVTETNAREVARVGDYTLYSVPVR